MIGTRPWVQESFADKIRRDMEAQVAHAGDWLVEHYDGRYKVYFYGNFRGWFDTVDEVLEEVPNWARDSIRKQIARAHQTDLNI